MPNPDFSNVRSGSSSTAPGENGENTESGRTYVVKPGDSLSKIAQQLYGNQSDWRKIYDANRDVIKDPDLIYAGQTLRLP
jgi:nucleoid-associated protein YgaU